MKTTKSTSKKLAENASTATITKATKNDELFTFSFPRNYTPFYVVLLVIMSFLLGALTVKTQMLGQPINQVAGTGQGVVVTPTGPAPIVHVTNGHFPGLGQDNAPVKIVEFADFRCPFCKSLHDTTLPSIKTDYINTGKVQFFFRQYPFLGPASTVAANAAECANEQGKFWDFHEYMYTNQPVETDTSLYTTDKLTAVAGQLGMNTDQFSSCLSSNKYSQQASADLADGQKAGVSGTPTLFINGQMLVGAQPYDTIKAAIETALQNK